MPCDTIQETSVEMKNPNISILMDALKSLGLEPQHNANAGMISFRNGTFRNGVITIRDSGYSRTKQVTAEDIKVAYSSQIVGFAAKQFGWKVEDVTKKVAQKPGVMATFRVKK